MVISVLFDPGADAAQALGCEEKVGREVFQGDALQQLGIFAQHATVLFAFAAPGVVGEIVLVAAPVVICRSIDSLMLCPSLPWHSHVPSHSWQVLVSTAYARD